MSDSFIALVDADVSAEAASDVSTDHGAIRLLQAV
jgi:hypothetical protein